MAVGIIAGIKKFYDWTQKKDQNDQTRSEGKPVNPKDEVNEKSSGESAPVSGQTLPQEVQDGNIGNRLEPKTAGRQLDEEGDEVVSDGRPVYVVGLSTLIRMLSVNW